MKPKIIGFIVISVLTISMVVTTVAAIQQAVRGEDPANLRRDLFVSNVEASNQGNPEETSLYSAFTFVCPFH